jgi:hypothetical protein
MASIGRSINKNRKKNRKHVDNDNVQKNQIEIKKLKIELNKKQIAKIDKKEISKEVKLEVNKLLKDNIQDKQIKHLQNEINVLRKEINSLKNTPKNIIKEKVKEVITIDNSKDINELNNRIKMLEMIHKIY